MLSDDPVIRELRQLRDTIRYVGFFTLGLYVVFTIAVAIALFIRSSDLNTATERANAVQVQTCFRDAAKRPGLQHIHRSRTATPSVRGFALTLLQNTPTVEDCHDLSLRLGVSVR